MRNLLVALVATAVLHATAVSAVPVPPADPYCEQGPLRCNGKMFEQCLDGYYAPMWNCANPDNEYSVCAFDDKLVGCINAQDHGWVWHDHSNGRWLGPKDATTPPTTTYPGPAPKVFDTSAINFGIGPATWKQVERPPVRAEGAFAQAAPLSSLGKRSSDTKLLRREEELITAVSTGWWDKQLEEQRNKFNALFKELRETLIRESLRPQKRDEELITAVSTGWWQKQYDKWFKWFQENVNVNREKRSQELVTDTLVVDYLQTIAAKLLKGADTAHQEIAVNRKRQNSFDPNWKYDPKNCGTKFGDPKSYTYQCLGPGMFWDVLNIVQNNPNDYEHVNIFAMINSAWSSLLTKRYTNAAGVVFPEYDPNWKEGKSKCGKKFGDRLNYSYDCLGPFFWTVFNEALAHMANYPEGTLSYMIMEAVAHKSLLGMRSIDLDLEKRVYGCDGSTSDPKSFTPQCLGSLYWPIMAYVAKHRDQYANIPIPTNFPPNIPTKRDGAIGTDAFFDKCGAGGLANPKFFTPECMGADTFASVQSIVKSFNSKAGKTLGNLVQRGALDADWTIDPEKCGTGGFADPKFLSPECLGWDVFVAIKYHQNFITPELAKAWWDGHVEAGKKYTAFLGRGVPKRDDFQFDPVKCGFGGFADPKFFTPECLGESTYQGAKAKMEGVTPEEATEAWMEALRNDQIPESTTQEASGFDKAGATVTGETTTTRRTSATATTTIPSPFTFRTLSLTTDNQPPTFETVGPEATKVIDIGIGLGAFTIEATGGVVTDAIIPDEQDEYPAPTDMPTEIPAPTDMPTEIAAPVFTAVPTIGLNVQGLWGGTFVDPNAAALKTREIIANMGKKMASAAQEISTKMAAEQTRLDLIALQEAAIQQAATGIYDTAPANNASSAEFALSALINDNGNPMAKRDSVDLEFYDNFRKRPKQVMYADDPFPDGKFPTVEQMGKFNTLVLGYYLSSHSFQLKATDNAGVWDSMDRQERLALKKQYNDAGIAVMVGAFGATDNPTISHPYVAGTKLGYYVLGNDFDGVDVDFQDTDAFKDSKGVDWLVTFTNVLRRTMGPTRLMSHSPLAPWFNPLYYENGNNYRDVFIKTGKAIDWYNVKYYDQGEDAYTDCTTMMWSSRAPEWTRMTAVNELITLGIPAAKIVVGKPLLASQASNGGYMDFDTLQDCARMGHLSYWAPQFMFWQWTGAIRPATALNIVLATPPV